MNIQTIIQINRSSLQNISLGVKSHPLMKIDKQSGDKQRGYKNTDPEFDVASGGSYNQTLGFQAPDSYATLFNNVEKSFDREKVDLKPNDFSTQEKNIYKILSDSDDEIDEIKNALKDFDIKGCNTIGLYNHLKDNGIMIGYTKCRDLMSQISSSKIDVFSNVSGSESQLLYKATLGIKHTEIKDENGVTLVKPNGVHEYIIKGGKFITAVGSISFAVNTSNFYSVIKTPCLVITMKISDNPWIIDYFKSIKKLERQIRSIDLRVKDSSNIFETLWFANVGDEEIVESFYGASEDDISNIFETLKDESIKLFAPLISMNVRRGAKLYTNSTLVSKFSTDSSIWNEDGTLTTEKCKVQIKNLHKSGFVIAILNKNNDEELERVSVCYDRWLVSDIHKC